VMKLCREGGNYRNFMTLPGLKEGAMASVN
jgi:hypothetical protein